MVILAITGCSRGPISGSFLLSPDSPPPTWFTSGQTNTRFTIDIYEPPFTTVGSVRATVLNSQGKPIGHAEGKWEWHPTTLDRPATQYPKWIRIRIQGTSEIYEQKELTNVLTIVDAVQVEKE